MAFEDRILLLSPQIWRAAGDPDRFEVKPNPSLTTRKFLDDCNDDCNFILQPKQPGGFACFQPDPQMRRFVPGIDRETAFDASARVISWGKRPDLRDCPRSDLAYPNAAAPRVMVYRFITVRFESRDADLQQTLSEVKTWSKVGYDPNINVGEVERAIALDISQGL